MVDRGRDRDRERAIRRVRGTSLGGGGPEEGGARTNVLWVLVVEGEVDIGGTSGGKE